MDYMSILNKVTSEATDFINNPSRLDSLLVQLEQKLQSIPAIGQKVSELPVMIAMVKSWIKGEYQFSVKVLATMVGAFIYLVKKDDLISDGIPVIGIVDDVAILGLALKFVEPDVNAYRAWRAGQTGRGAFEAGGAVQS